MLDDLYIALKEAKTELKALSTHGITNTSRLGELLGVISEIQETIIKLQRAKIEKLTKISNFN